MRIQLHALRRRNYFTSTRVASSSIKNSESRVEVPKIYDPGSVEKKIIEKWKNRKGYERATILDEMSGAEDNQSVFRMILPPPNVTGKLHLGHALTVAIEDTFIRWYIMRGRKVEWIPGFDHAGIATQSMVLRKFAKKCSNSRAVDPTELQNQLHQFSIENRSVITSQLEAMGGLLDWQSEYFTLDQKHSEVVKRGFTNLFNAGLIERGNGIVNWCCTLKSSIADIEVEQVDFSGRISLHVPGYKKPVQFGVLYFISYPIENSDEKLIIATSRPETMFGDVAVAVNPSDTRYVEFIGKNVVNPINGEILPIISSSRVKSDFGSGVLKVTPAHDKLDFIIGADHGLQLVNIFDPEGTVNENGGECTGLGRFLARQKVIDLLQKKSAVMDVKDYSGSLGLCSRTGDIIEPRILPHWFLRTKNLTESFLSCVNFKELVILPQNQLQALKNKLMRVEDWCLSRQIQWGHRVPAYFHVSSPDVWVSEMNIQMARNKLETVLGITIKDESEVKQDKDVLDTWFSSALIPLSISNWPDQLKFNDISLMETGYDIVLYWVWRMAIVTLALTGKLPFRKVMLHGMVTDQYGRKMSKSRGNVINPMHIINGISFQELMKDAEECLESGELDQNEYNLRIKALKKEFPRGFPKCGSDGLRFALLAQDIFNQDIKMDVIYLENCKRFCNKMWQAMRFFNMNADEGINRSTNTVTPSGMKLNSVADKWILSCLHKFAFEAFENTSHGHLHLYSEGIRKFLYQQLCDVYIELIKHDMKNGLNTEQHTIVMRYVLETGLKVAHPLLPFVTEEIWSHLTQDQNGLLIDQSLPVAADLEEYCNPELLNGMSKALKIVKEIRTVQTKEGMKTTTVVYVEIQSTDMKDVDDLKESIEILCRCAVHFEPPSIENRNKCLAYPFDLNGTSGQISILKTEEPQESVHLDAAKIEKLQRKLQKLKQQYENPSFQMQGKPEAREKLRKKVEIIQIQLDESNSHISKKSS